MKTIIAAALTGFLLVAVSAETVRVYFGTQGRGESKGIYVSDFDTARGTLTEPQLAAEIGGCGFLALHPSGKYLYSTARADGNAVAAFKITPDGTLMPINTQPSEGSSPCHVSVDATGSCLMVANYGSGSVAAFKIDEDGSLVKSASAHTHEGSSVNQQRQEGPHAHSIYPGPDNKFAYAPDLGIDKVMIYKLDAESAKLTGAGAAKTPPGSGPRHMKFGKDGKQAYVLNEMLVTVSVYDRDPATGLLKEKQVVSTGTEKDGMSCSEIRVHPGGKHIYAANRDVAGKDRDSISVFEVLAGGELKLIEVAPAKVQIPRNINLSPNGNWLLVAGQRSGNVPVFRVGKDGKLTPTDAEVKVANAMCVEFVK